MLNKTHNVTVDLLKCNALLLVFVCHCYICCMQTFGFQFTCDWQFFLKTPAWAGVWIFMIVSGFLAGTGFFSGEYMLSRQGIWRYYKSRLLRVLIPTWIMLAIYYILADPQIPNALTLLKYLTCMFRGPGGPRGAGATWYVFSIMWLYLLTPWVVYIFHQIEKQKNPVKHYLILLFAMILYGLLYRNVGSMMALDWSRWLYTSPLANIDLFVSGMIVSRIRHFKKQKEAPSKRRLLEILLALLMLTCSYLYFYGETTRPAMLLFYQMVVPSICIFVVGGILFASYETTEPRRAEKWTASGAKYSFQFYLWHSIIYYHVAQTIVVAEPFGRYLATLCLGTALTALIAWLMECMNQEVTRRIKKQNYEMSLRPDKGRRS